MSEIRGRTVQRVQFVIRFLHGIDAGVLDGWRRTEDRWPSGYGHYVDGTLSEMPRDRFRQEQAICGAEVSGEIDYGVREDRICPACWNEHLKRALVWQERPCTGS